RVKGEERFRRSSVESYRGQALDAWAAGADGIHLFNLFDVAGPHSPIFKEVGDPQALRAMSKLYYVTVRDGKPETWLAGGSKYSTLPILTPAHPVTITASKPLALDLAVGEDFDPATTAKPTLHAHLPRVHNAREVCIKLNGHELTGGNLAKGWLDFNVDPAWLKKGANPIEIAIKPQPVTSNTPWTVAYVAGKLPALPWTRDQSSAKTEARMERGALLIADRGTAVGDYHYYRHLWGADPAGVSVVEARVKVLSGLSRVIISNGATQERLELWPDRIELWRNKKIR
ncbi:MAG: hypothetical protein NTY53_15680, partial [Kiritimatiellaeota bacterium]|nr:hypothetical protein [Kiritimatiellota bacterium]